MTSTWFTRTCVTLSAKSATARVRVLRSIRSSCRIWKFSTYVAQERFDPVDKITLIDKRSQVVPQVSRCCNERIDPGWQKHQASSLPGQLVHDRFCVKTLEVPATGSCLYCVRERVATNWLMFTVWSSVQKPHQLSDAEKCGGKAKRDWAKALTPICS